MAAASKAPPATPPTAAPAMAPVDMEPDPAVSGSVATVDSAGFELAVGVAFVVETSVVSAPVPVAVAVVEAVVVVVEIVEHDAVLMASPQK